MREGKSVMSKKKDVSAIISGLGWALGFLQLLMGKAQQAGLSEEVIHRLGTPDGEKYINALIELMRKDTLALPGPVMVPAMPYEATVDMPHLREQAGEGYQNLKKNFGFDWVNGDINPETFPLEGNGLFLNLGFTFVHLNRNATSDEALAAMEREGLRPATFAELLAFSLKYPELQRQFPIVALGSSALIRGDRRVPYLDGHSRVRNLRLNWVGRAWNADCRFLAVRK